MKFRFTFWPTVVSVPAFIILLGLGTWQVQRLHWKENLIAERTARTTAAPIALPQPQQHLSPAELDDLDGWKVGAGDVGQAAVDESRLVHQPWRTFYQPIRTLYRRAPAPVTFVGCTGYNNAPFNEPLSAMESEPGVRVLKIDTGHFCMLTAVEETVGALEA